MLPVPTSPREALATFATLSPSTIRLGLDRVHLALEQLGRPDRAYRTLQIAGTNGKGSACAFAAELLRRAGYRVGLYTSPHLVRVTERIRVDGEELSEEAFGAALREVFTRCPQALAEPAELTYFEVGTLAALWHFAQVGVDLAVLETGLGGRLDATTAATAQVTALTSISLDHPQYLGSTVEAIAAEKAGILRPGVPAVVSAQVPAVLEVLQARAQQVGAPLLLEGRDFQLERLTGGGLRYRGPGEPVPQPLTLSLAGPHQASNAAVALTAARLLGGADRVGGEVAQAGLATTSWPGRFEQLAQQPAVIVDGAHNQAGADALVATLAERWPGRRVHLVFGVLADKDHAAIRARLFPGCASIHLCPVPSPRGLAPEASLADARAATPSVHLHPSVEAALAAARAGAGAQDVVLCAGSLFLVGAVRASFGK